MKTRWQLPAMAIGILVASSIGRAQVYPDKYEGAMYLHDDHSDVLKIFPPKGPLVTVSLPFFLVGPARFGSDGRSMYGIVADRKSTVRPNHAGISKIEFDPIRATLMPGTSEFAIKSFAISSRQDKLVISGRVQSSGARRCGVFAVDIPAGNVKQILIGECRDEWSWDYLSLSPNGDRAVASHDRHLELIDLVQGTTRSLGSEFDVGSWSPDGKWIAVRESGNRDRLFLIDAANLSRRHSLGAAVVIMPEWSPDSRYLLLWKGYIFRCGFYLDVDAPATLETLDIQTGKRSTIKSSRCQITNGETGWVSSEIAR